jgi:septum site-determining protein MinC
MNRPILVKSFSNGITIVCSPEADFEQVLQASAQHFKNTARFFAKASLSLRLQGRLFAEDEVLRLVKIIEEAAGVKIIGVTNADEDPLEDEINTIRKIQEQIPSLSKVIRGPVRCGQIIREDVSLVIEGDVHTGASIYSSGNILVLGKLEGLAHAGYPENEKCFISANSFNPSGLWIGKVEGREKYLSSIHQIARVVDGELILETADKRKEPLPEELEEENILWFTSAERESGTSSCLMQTAYLLAYSGKKVLYIDLDGGRMLPKSSADFQMEALLDGKCTFFQAAVKDKNYSDLIFLSAEDGVDLGLKRQESFHALIADKKREFDYILIDHAKPIERDIAYLFSEANRVFLVSRGDYQSVLQSDQLLGQFADAGQNVEIPVLINAYTDNKNDMDYLSKEEISAYLGSPIAIFIPQDDNMPKLLGDVSENGPAALALCEFTSLLLGQEVLPKEEKSGFFSKNKRGRFLFKKGNK